MKEYRIYGDIKDKKYLSLIGYLLKRCDVFTFYLPNTDKRIITEKNVELFSGYEKFFPEYKIGHIEIANNCERFKQYKYAVKERLKWVSKNLLKVYEDVEYAGSIYQYVFEIYVVSIDDTNMVGFLSASEGLYSWRAPDEPEDLCFFSKGRCVMRSVAHEKLCFLYTDDPDIKKHLKKLKLKLIDDIEYEKIPRLSYTLEY